LLNCFHNRDGNREEKEKTDERKPKSRTNYGKTESESFELVWTCNEEIGKSLEE
jgi:hypothetical protein